MQTDLEKKHVQNVYETIAAHFSGTRYKPWPLVESHIKTLEVGSIVADVGCGNGKYLGCNPQVFAIGSDQSTNLIKICKERGHECLVSDGLTLPFRDMSCDHAICIAVVHHFSTRENRISALNELKRIVKIGGTVLVTVWAFEQEKKKYTEQDVMIKWHLQKRYDPATSSNTPEPKKSRKKKDKRDKNKTGENAASSSNDGCVTLNNDNTVTNSDNTIKIAESNTEAIESTDSASHGDDKASSSNEDPAALQPADPSQSQVLERYYHLFKKGELDELVTDAGGFDIVESVWDVDNWYLVLKRNQ